jgi:tetratricopeptide (TPR) repeat protein
VRLVLHDDETEVELEAPWTGGYAPPRRRRLGVWLLVAFLVPSIALLGWIAETRYHVVALLTHRPAASEGEPATDPRLDAFVAKAERALTDGDLDAAQSGFDKASVVGEHDARVLLGLARVAGAKADVPWLRVRLLQPEATDASRVARAELAERVATARRTADDALAAAPQDPRALTAKLDALRLAGDLPGARGYTTAVLGQATQPEAAYALAALDLDAPAAFSTVVIDRLRLAIGSAPASGRARAALVCALAKSDDIVGAKAELASLDAQPRPYPVLPELHAWLDRATAATAGVPAAPSDTTASVANGAPSASAAPAAAAPPPEATGAPSKADRASGGVTALQAAGQAINRGDLDQAERIYGGLLATVPYDSQAQSGLGDIARLRREPGAAIAAYSRALQSNPSYLPALLGLGDTQWTIGDHDGAVKTYQRIVDSFPTGIYPSYVRRRLEESSSP